MKLDQVHPYVWLAGAALLGLWWLGREGNARSAGQAAGGAAVDLAAGAFEGVVYGAGDAVGLPRTDPDKCRAALDAGDLWAASFDCPAGDFLGGAWDQLTGDKPPAYTGGASGSW